MDNFCEFEMQYVLLYNYWMEIILVAGVIKVQYWMLRLYTEALSMSLLQTIEPF